MSETKNINDVIKQTSLSFIGLSEKDKAEKRGDMIIYALRNRTFLIFQKEGLILFDSSGYSMVLARKYDRLL